MGLFDTLTSFISTPAYAEEPVAPPAQEAETGDDAAGQNDEAVAKAQGVAEGEEEDGEGGAEDEGEGESEDGGDGSEEGEDGDDDDGDDDEGDEDEDDEEPEDIMPKLQDGSSFFSSVLMSTSTSTSTAFPVPFHPLL